YTEIHHSGLAGSAILDAELTARAKHGEISLSMKNRGAGMQPAGAGRVRKWIVLCGAAVCCSMAWGQYVWLNEKGVKQYSDKPPPPSVPDSRIIKPARNAGTQAASALASPPAPAAGDAPARPADAAPQASGKGAPTIAERNADFNKRRAQQAEADKKTADQQKLAQEKASNCERAASYKRSLESGARIARVGKNGEQAFISDEQRAQEIKEASKLLEGCA
ncbi:MAG: hypothetical protein Q7U14_10715, partial [Lacisediminimonas sp.]|nr:hypothetical protein [Lacisediminimonas sp.]